MVSGETGGDATTIKQSPNQARMFLTRRCQEFLTMGEAASTHSSSTEPGYRDSPAAKNKAISCTTGDCIRAGTTGYFPAKTYAAGTSTCNPLRPETSFTE